MQKEEIKVRWRSFFEKLLNETHTRNTILEESGNIMKIRESRFFCRIRVIEVNFALSKMKSRRTLGLDGIPIED